MKRCTRLLSMVLALALAWSAAPRAQEPAATPVAAATPEAAATPAPETPAAAPGAVRVKFETTLGDFTLELYPDKAPISVANFVRYVNEGYYTGTVFHRVIPGFMAQGGGLTAEMDEKSAGLHGPIMNESSTGLANTKGTISMARAGVNTATSQFFINLVDNPRLDVNRENNGAYAAFGKVVEGADTIDKIAGAKLIVHPKYDHGEGAVTPETPIVVSKATVVQAGDAAQEAAALKGNDEKFAKLAADAEAAAKNAQSSQGGAIENVVSAAEKEGGKKAVKAASGLIYIQLRPGTGDRSPALTDTVRVHYEGKLLDGSVFDSSYQRGQPLEFPLNGVIKGWGEGVGMMKKGEKAMLIIPPDLGYGAQGAGDKIPGNSYLVFTIELIDIL